MVPCCLDLHYPPLSFVSLPLDLALSHSSLDLFGTPILHALFLSSGWDAAAMLASDTTSTTQFSTSKPIEWDLAVRVVILNGQSSNLQMSC